MTDDREIILNNAQKADKNRNKTLKEAPSWNGQW